MMEKVNSCGSKKRCNVDPIGLSGGLALWWDNEVQLATKWAYQNFVDPTTTTADGALFTLNRNHQEDTGIERVKGNG